ncbi:MAG: cation:proton antiporter [Chloroflexota bacterium]|nr:cation:proton antiporter [Chloroflexota bacterium]
MPETGGLLVNLALALIGATVGGAVAARLGQSPIVGYVGAGVLIGPYTPGPASEPEAVAALADLGLVFLLFAVGLQLSVGELLRVGRAALVGGTLQVVILIAIGYGVAVGVGFPPLEAVFFGAFVSLSSTTVMAKILSDRGEIDAGHGMLAMAWATTQDLITIVLVVLLTAVAAGSEVGGDVVLAVGKAVLFMGIVLPIGFFGLPWLLRHASLLRSRELFVLTVVALALGTAYASQVFGLSLALGAFLAGLLVSESEESYQALGELGPLRDVFAGLFFVFIGMLVDPGFVVLSMPLLLAALLLIVAVKGAVAALLAFLLRVPRRTAILAGVALAQAGEFSFLLARVGQDAGAVGQQMFSLMLAGAAVSIVIAPGLIRSAPVALRAADLRFGGAGGPASAQAGAVDVPTERRRFVLICGFGRVGRLIGEALEPRGFRYRAVDSDPRVCRAAAERGVDVVQGHAENPRVLERADVAAASVLVVALPDPLAMRQVVDHARRVNPRLPIIARARSSADREFLARHGVGEIVFAETEVALEMARYTLGRLGVSAAETTAIVRGLRRRAS